MTIHGGLQPVGAPRLILASGSAARAALLAGTGLKFETRPAAVDERAIKVAALARGAGAEDTAMRLADAKARTVADAGALVIGADQILVCEGAWYDKPVDLGAAKRQLRRLQGRTHTLVTAIVCRRAGAVVWQHMATPRLTMRAWSDAFIDAYLRIEGARALTSVGGYRLEGPGIHLFTAIEGEHTAVLGLPLLPLLAFLREAGAALV